MSEMVERVARAIYAHAGSSPSGQPTWDEEDAEMHEWFMGHARAAIEAMREPTEAMERAGHGWQTLPKPAWTAMIDEALK